MENTCSHQISSISENFFDHFHPPYSWTIILLLCDPEFTNRLLMAYLTKIFFKKIEIQYSTGGFFFLRQACVIEKCYLVKVECQYLRISETKFNEESNLK